jgi:hypothetical protein
MENPMSEMPNLFHNEFIGQSNIIWTIVVGLLIGLTYFLIKRIILPLLGYGRKAKQWRWRLYIIERLYFPVLGLAILISILISKPLVGVVLSAILVLVLYKPIVKYVLGLIYRIGKTYSIGQRILVEGQHGSIRSFNALSIELELEDGSMLDIPYDIFSHSKVVRSSPKSGVLSHSIELAIPKPCEIAQVKQSIQMHLLSMPYVLPNQKINIVHLADEELRYLIKVTIHGLEKQQMYAVETELKAIFTKVKMNK